MEKIKGYTYGQVAQSPVSLADLDLLKKTVKGIGNLKHHNLLAVVKSQTWIESWKRSQI